MNDIATLAARPADRPQTVLTPTVTGGRERVIFVPLKNEPGVQRHLDKNLLHIDPQYQRKINERQVARMVGNWNWVSCGTLEVSQRPGSDLFFVVDGQHRWQAAMYLPEVTDIPCIIFELDTIKDEAIAFLAANVERRMPTVNDQFKALLIAGDPIAVAMDKLLATCSRTIGPTHDAEHVSCLGAFAGLMRRNRAAMERVFPLLAELARGRPMPHRLFRAVHWLERCMPRGQSLTDEKWRSRIVSDRVGYDRILETIRVTSLNDPRGGDRAMAQGLLRAINHNLRIPLSIPNIDRPSR